FGKESPDYFSFGAEGGELNYYFIAGPEPKKIVQQFTALVGRTPLPPLWSLGYQQSRYSYYPEARAREVVQTLREKKIPATSFILTSIISRATPPSPLTETFFRISKR